MEPNGKIRREAARGAACTLAHSAAARRVKMINTSMSHVDDSRYCTKQDDSKRTKGKYKIM